MFFNNLVHDEVVHICSIRKEKEFAESQVIISQGDSIKEFVYLKEGLVKLSYMDTDGLEQIITVAQPLDFVSIMSVFSSDTYNYSVTALMPSVVCSIDMELLQSIGNNNASFSFDLLKRLSKANDDILLESLELKRHQLKGKLAYILLKFADKIFKNHEFDLPLTRKEIAEYAGVSTENIIRALSQFRKEKIISISGKTIEIRDMERLKLIAKFG
jgi:CRP/FNR family transcriptional regulator